MTMVDMSHFMNKDFPPVFLQVFPADDNILHPTERSYLLIVHHKCNSFLQLLMFAGMYQPEETNQRIDIATDKKQNTRQIDQQNNLYPRYSRRLLHCTDIGRSSLQLCHQ